MDNRLDIIIDVDANNGRAVINGVTHDLENLGTRGRQAMDGLTSSVGYLATGFAAWKAVDWTRDTAMLSARYETLGVVMDQVGKNAGYTNQQMDGFATGLQRNGITMLESRNSLAQLSQAHIELAEASGLARISQDAAVMAGKNSSETYATMIYGIQSAQVDVLRSIGLNVNFEQSYQRLAAQLGKSTQALSEEEKITARVNEVKAAGAKIAGTYEAAMGTAGKQVASLARYEEDFRVKMGEAFGPAISILVSQVTEEFKYLQEEVAKPETQEQIKSMASSIASFGKSAVETLHYAPDVLHFVDEWGGQLVSIVATLKAAELAQLAYNSAVLKNPYVIAAAAGVAISQQIHKSQGDWQAGKFDNSIPMGSTAVDPNSGYEAGGGIDTAVRNLEDERILELQAQKAKAFKASAAAMGEESKAQDENSSKVKAHQRELQGLIDKYLPLKAEAAEVAKAQAGLGELLAKGVITGAEYAQGMDAIEQSTIKAKEATKAAKEVTKEATEAWKEYKSAMADLTTGVMGDHERQVYAIEQRYDGLEDKLVEMVDTGRMTFEEAERWQNDLANAKGIDLAKADSAINSFVSKHEDAAFKVETVWGSAVNGLNVGMDEWVRNGELSAESVRNAFSASFRGIVSDWIQGVSTMNAHSPQMQSIGGTAALLSTMSGSGSGYGSLWSGGVGILNELMNPGSYSASLGSLQSSISSLASAVGWNSGAGTASGAMLAENFGSAAPTPISNMSSSAFGATTAGLGNFAMGLMQGKNVGQAGASGGGAALGFYLGSMTPLGPIGGMIGSTIGSMLGDTVGESLFGGDDPWVRRWYDNVTVKNGKFNVAPGGEFSPMFEQAEASISGMLSQFPAEMATRIKASFGDEWGTKSWNSGKEDTLGDVANELSAWLSTSIHQTMGQAMIEVVGGDLLTPEMVERLKAQAAAGTDLTQYFQGLVAITSTIDQAVATHGLSDYQLEIKGINDKFEALGVQLEAQGVALDRYTNLEKAHALALDDANQKEQHRLDLIRKQAASLDSITSGTSGIDTMFSTLIDSWGQLQQAKVAFEGPMRDESLLAMGGAIPGVTVPEGATAESIMAAGEKARDAFFPVVDGFVAKATDMVATLDGSIQALSPMEDSDVAKIRNLATVIDTAQSFLDTVHTLGTGVSDYDSKINQLRDKASGVVNSGQETLGTMIDQFFAPITSVIDKHGKNGKQQDFDALQQELDAWTQRGEQLKEILGDRFDWDAWQGKIVEYAADRTEELKKKWIDPVTDSWRDFFADMKTSNLAPSQSREAYDDRFATLLNAANDGMGDEQADAAALQAFTPQYLQFLQDYDPGNYAQVFEFIMDQLRISAEAMAARAQDSGVTSSEYTPPPVHLGGNDGPIQLNVTVQVGDTNLGTAMARTISINPDVQNAVTRAVRIGGMRD